MTAIKTKYFKNPDWRIEHDVTDFYQGQTNGSIYVKDKKANLLLGGVDYQQYGDEVTIALIAVRPEYRRMGIASAVLNELKKEWPGKKIRSGLMTDEGYALQLGIKYPQKHTKSILKISKMPKAKTAKAPRLTIPHPVKRGTGITRRSNR